jgi:protein-S-isoprenylcysteine O-methyltransferase Ste14
VDKKREEPELEKRFGEAYRDYKKNTPFLIPSFKAKKRNYAGEKLG